MTPSESHYEMSLQKDIDRIKNTIIEMAQLNEGALRNSIKALVNKDRQLAYTVILRDRIIDALETELDRLCIEFIVRQQPVGCHLRFVYATIKIIREMERIGDYAESIARQVLHIIPLQPLPPLEPFIELADVSIQMFHDAVQAFLNRNIEKAKTLMAIEDQADGLRSHINQQLFKLQESGKLALDALTPLMTIARRLERLADQAKNICEEVIYMTTGQVSKHKHSDIFNILFVDAENACLSKMAEAIGRAITEPRFNFSSAGINPAQSVDSMTVSFLAQKGTKMDAGSPVSLISVWKNQPGHVIVALGVDIRKALPSEVINPIIFDWPVKDPSHQPGSSAEKSSAYERVYLFLQNQIQDIMEAVIGYGEIRHKVLNEKG